MTENTYRTKTGRTLTDKDIHKLADAIAHHDYQPTTRKRGRPPLGNGPSELVPVRLDPDLHAALTNRATQDNTTISEIIRTALKHYLDAA